MKYEFIGNDDSYCIELIAYNLVPRGSYLKKGQKITVPDDNEFVIKSLDASGVFKRVQDKKVTKKGKK